MTQPADLIRFLVEHYDLIKRRVSFKVGSRELAEDVMQDTYLRLQSREGEGAVRDPSNFILRTALNLAIDRIRTDRRLLSGDEVEHLIEQEVAPFDPQEEALGRRELEMLSEALDRLPPLRRELFMASRLDGVPQKELARQYGISLRKVESEVHLAHETLARKIQRYGPDSSN
ncbi:RNA polymerase sigma factor [Pandoraea communis]|uniref:RNA polymerase sigma factor n=1 Tax=Pandoraea communis TaxID=2508297 RepID=UPI0025A57B37|nr:RNA polymerase sigma factor [Pandoraea communis]MDM8355862.1 RNA polymerase sigma factor [Pandoraea communis]